MMLRVGMFFTFVFVLMSVSNAEQATVKADEIRAILTGNTIHGTWYGQEYKQYFYEDGRTIYAPKKSQSSSGKWRVDEANDLYESWWERTDWVGYRIIRKNGELFWVGDRNEPQPFTVLPGEQLVWKQQ